MYLAWKEKCCSACLFPNDTSEQCAGKHKGTYVLWFAYWRRSSATCLNGRAGPPSRPAGTGKRSKWGSSCSFVNRCLNSLCLAGSVQVALRVQPTTSRLRNMQNQPRVGSVEGCHQGFKHLWQGIFLVIRGSLRCQPWPLLRDFGKKKRKKRRSSRWYVSRELRLFLFFCFFFNRTVTALSCSLCVCKYCISKLNKNAAAGHYSHCEHCQALRQITVNQWLW